MNVLIHQGLVCYGNSSSGLLMSTWGPNTGNSTGDNRARGDCSRSAVLLLLLLLLCSCRQTSLLPPDRSVCWFALCCETRGFTGRHAGSESVNVPYLLIRRQSHRVWSSGLKHQLLSPRRPLCPSGLCVQPSRQNISHMLLTYIDAGCIHDRLNSVYYKQTKRNQTQ